MYPIGSRFNSDSSNTAGNIAACPAVTATGTDFGASAVAAAVATTFSGTDFDFINLTANPVTNNSTANPNNTGTQGNGLLRAGPGTGLAGSFTGVDFTGWGATGFFTAGTAAGLVVTVATGCTGARAGAGGGNPTTLVDGFTTCACAGPAGAGAAGADSAAFAPIAFPAVIHAGAHSPATGTGASPAVHTGNPSDFASASVNHACPAGTPVTCSATGVSPSNPPFKNPPTRPAIFSAASPKS